MKLSRYRKEICIHLQSRVAVSSNFKARICAVNYILEFGKLRSVWFEQKRVVFCIYFSFLRDSSLKNLFDFIFVFNF